MALETPEIMEILPHRPPILMVERVLFLRPGQRGIGVRMVDRGDPWLSTREASGDFPELLCVEAIAQMGAIVLITGRCGAFEEGTAIHGVLATIPKMEILEIPRPARVLSTHVELRRVMPTFGMLSGEIVADGRTVARGDLGLALDLPDEEEA